MLTPNAKHQKLVLKKINTQLKNRGDGTLAIIQSTTVPSHALMQTRDVKIPSNILEMYKIHLMSIVCWFLSPTQNIKNCLHTTNHRGMEHWPAAGHRSGWKKTWNCLPPENKQPRPPLRSSQNKIPTAPLLTLHGKRESVKHQIEKSLANPPKPKGA